MRSNERSHLSCRSIAVAAALVLGLVAAAPADTQDREPRKQAAPGSAPESASGQAAALESPYKASSWIGKQVRNSEGEALGRVKDLAMDDQGKVRYVVMEIDPPEGEKDRLVAVPLRNFSFPVTAADHLIFETDRSRLQGAPAFGSDRWPDMGDMAWSTGVIDYWIPRGWQTDADRRPATDSHSSVMQGRQQTQSALESAQEVANPADPLTNEGTVYTIGEKELLFERMDANKDGFVDREEARADGRVLLQFAEIDAFGNGRISPSEFAAFELHPPRGRSQ